MAFLPPSQPGQSHCPLGPESMHLLTRNRYNALAGIADPSNSFFLIPVAHFPWSDKGRERREKVDNDEARAEQMA